MDAVYMEAVQAITGSGGWPMSVFLTPDRRPFFGGTYFPPDDRPGMPSFRTVLAAIADIWDNRRSEVESRPAELAAGRSPPARWSKPRPGRLLRRIDRAPRPTSWPPAVEELARRFDPQWGGFGGRPSSPSRPWSTSLLYHSLRRPGHPGRRPVASRWPPSPSTPWPPAASTTTSAAASPATPPTTSGWSPTSRRCSTTRPACCGPSSTGGRSPGERTTCGWSKGSSTTWAAT